MAKFGHVSGTSDNKSRGLINTTDYSILFFLLDINTYVSDCILNIMWLIFTFLSHFLLMYIVNPLSLGSHHSFIHSFITTISQPLRYAFVVRLLLCLFVCLHHCKKQHTQLV